MNRKFDPVTITHKATLCYKAKRICFHFIGFLKAAWEVIWLKEHYEIQMKESNDGKYGEFFISGWSIKSEHPMIAVHKDFGLPKEEP